MSDGNQILLPDGTLLVRGDDDSVMPVVLDLLIEGSFISKIGSRQQLAKFYREMRGDRLQR